MGYYTDFTIQYEGMLHEGDFLDAFNSPTGYEMGGDFQLENVKWYDQWDNHEKHMRKLSKKFPGILFKVYGIGEDPYDSWMAYYKNGKHVKHRPKVVWPEFNEADLS